MLIEKDENCSRCGVEITCRVDDIELCKCSKVSLQEETMDFLKITNYDCLCNKCLKELEKLVLIAKASNTELEEGKHYYLENNLMVFTELYLIQRGYCCKNNCRHCAYGYKVE
jgi:hypothetical protein